MKILDEIQYRVRELACFLAACTGFSIAQQQRPAQPQTPTFRVQSSLVLVDVISQDPKSGLPVRDFRKEDFRLFDGGHEMRISTFDAGARYDTRPITVWLVVICNESGLPKFGASAEFLGQESLFGRALDHLEPRDTVGVAHWCDNGDSHLDLLPTEDRNKVIEGLAETLKPIPFEGGTFVSDEAGEQAFRKLIRLIIRDAYRKHPKPLPVIVFLHGDHTGQPHRQLNKLVDDFLETSGIVFEYAARRGWAMAGEYIDAGVSGSKESRPQLNALMKAAKQRRFDAVLVWKLDRFGRSLRHLVTALADLHAVGVAFVSFKEGLDLSTPTGRLMFHIVGAIAEFERELIRERVRAGMAHARSKGRKLGRPTANVDLRDVSARRAAGESLRAIARDLGCSPALLVKRANAVA